MIYKYLKALGTANALILSDKVHETKFFNYE